jgi:hypothetical protein
MDDSHYLWLLITKLTPKGKKKKKKQKKKKKNKTLNSIPCFLNLVKAQAIK